MMSPNENVQEPATPDKSTARVRKKPMSPVMGMLQWALVETEYVFFTGVQGPPGEGASSTVTTPSVKLFVTDKAPLPVNPVIWKSAAFESGPARLNSKSQ